AWAAARGTVRAQGRGARPGCAAMASRSTGASVIVSLIAERDDGVHTGGAPRGEQAEGDARDGRHGQRGDDGGRGDPGGDRGDAADEERQPPADGEADGAPDQRERGGLAEELPQDLPARGAYGLPDPDLAGAL